MGDRDRDRRTSNSRVYVGNLPPDVRERDLEGKHQSSWLSNFFSFLHSR